MEPFPRSTRCSRPTRPEDCLHGKIVNEKYECSKKEFNPPHVFVFMNRHPKFGASIMSADRYVIVEVGWVTSRNTFPAPRKLDKKPKEPKLKNALMSKSMVTPTTTTVSSLMEGRRKKTASQHSSQRKADSTVGRCGFTPCN